MVSYFFRSLLKFVNHFHQVSLWVVLFDPESNGVTSPDDRYDDDVDKEYQHSPKEKVIVMFSNYPDLNVLFENRGDEDPP